ncbi:MAG: glycosyltransferase [Patescibacteria group bacterium]|jgi:glycosyltransferase involved in cell wall biosynthesis
MENNCLLSLVMIVKNEAKGLRAAVESCKDFVDEVVILVDNKSSDDTLNIAENLTARVYRYAFFDNFSLARNLAAEHARGEWILYIDGHELVKNPENIRKYLQKGRDGVLVRVKMENGTMFPACRLYRRIFQFEGAIHEQLNCKDTVAATDFIIEHHREDLQDQKASEERAKQRDEQMPNIMGAQLKKDNKNTRASFHMALFYESKQDWKKALKYQKKYLKFSDVPGGRWFIYYHMASCLIERKQYFRAWLATCAAVAINPYRWEISELRAIIFFRQKNWHKATDYFVESFNENKGEVSFLPKQRNNAMTWNFIGECFFNLGEYWKASESFKSASKFCEDPAFKDLLSRRSDLMFKMAENKK